MVNIIFIIYIIWYCRNQIHINGKSLTFHIIINIIIVNVSLYDNHTSSIVSNSMQDYQILKFFQVKIILQRLLSSRNWFGIFSMIIESNVTFIELLLVVLVLLFVDVYLGTISQLLSNYNCVACWANYSCDCYWNNLQKWVTIFMNWIWFSINWQIWLLKLIVLLIGLLEIDSNCFEMVLSSYLF